MYEQILRIPYYIVLDRYTNQLRAFHLVGGHYQPMEIVDQRVMISEWKVSIGGWQGTHRSLQRPWLRWCDAENKLILTAEERAERLAQRLRDLGIDPNEV